MTGSSGLVTAAPWTRSRSQQVTSLTCTVTQAHWYLMQHVCWHCMISICIYNVVFDKRMLFYIMLYLIIECCFIFVAHQWILLKRYQTWMTRSRVTGMNEKGMLTLCATVYVDNDCISCWNQTCICLFCWFTNNYTSRYYYPVSTKR